MVKQSPRFTKPLPRKKQVDRARRVLGRPGVRLVIHMLLHLEQMLRDHGKPTTIRRGICVRPTASHLYRNSIPGRIGLVCKLWETFRRFIFVTLARLASTSITLL